jgi:hypothetical protein
MLILPSDDRQKARTLLDQAIADRFTITLLVFGDGKGEDQIASKADVRAQAMASTRRVVWIRDPNILSVQEVADYRQKNDEIVVCVLSLDDEPVAFLNRQQADSFVELERAFLKAQQA